MVGDNQCQQEKKKYQYIWQRLFYILTEMGSIQFVDFLENIN